MITTWPNGISEKKLFRSHIDRFFVNQTIIFADRLCVSTQARIIAPMMAREVRESDLPQWLSKRSGSIALLIFALSAALLLHKSLLPQYTLVPLEIIQDIKPWDHLALGPRANRLIIDPFFIFYPNRALQTAAIQGGQLPLWNPHLFTGTPVIADPNFQPFYLPNLDRSII